MSTNTREKLKRKEIEQNVNSTLGDQTYNVINY